MTDHYVMADPPERTRRTLWYGLRDEAQERRSFGMLHQAVDELTMSINRYPCAVRMHGADAYEIKAHREFLPNFEVNLRYGAVIGRIQNLAVVLDPQGIQGEIELVICPGCLSFHFPSCDYAAVAPR